MCVCVCMRMCMCVHEDVCVCMCTRISAFPHISICIYVACFFTYPDNEMVSDISNRELHYIIVFEATLKIPLKV